MTNNRHNDGSWKPVNSSLPEQNGNQFADENFRSIIVNDNFGILIKILMKFVPKGPVDIQRWFR